METLACLNGDIMPADQAAIPVWDRGFLFGDAVYEVFRLYQGRCWLEEDHLNRLHRSLDAMELPGVDLERLRERIHRTIRASFVKEGTAYIHITRGVAPRYHPFPKPPVPPTELIIIRPYDDGPTAELREQGVAAISQPDLRWKRCDVKSTNLLANVIALEHAQRAGGFEAILHDSDGNVTEATHSSILWVRGGRVEGTPEGPAILPGTKRLLIRRLAASQNIPIGESRITLDELEQADEVILSGTTIEILPIVTIDGIPVGGGRPGPVTRKLQAAYRAAVEKWLAT